MGKIKSQLAKAKGIISIKTYKRPLVYIILMMVFINILILTISAIIAWLTDDTYVTFIDAFANGSVKWMLTPNAILTIENPRTLALAVVVLITGLVLFSGTIIALTTNAIKDYIQNKHSGSGKIHLEQHIVILNWNTKVPELVSDLLFMDEAKVTVMILAKVDKNYAEKQIINHLNHARGKQDMSKMNVLVKNGDPLLFTDLDDISIQHAKTIIIMNPEHHEKVTKDMSQSDLAVIKNILSLGPIEFQFHPPIVVEIKFFETKEKILTLGRVVKDLSEHDLMPICFDKRLGQIIAQTIIEKHIEPVYLSLFSFKGSEVYMLENETIDNCLKTREQAVPIGKHKNALFVLSLNDQLKHKKSVHEHPVIPLKVKKYKENITKDVYVFGSNNKFQFIIESFRQYETLYGSQFTAHALQSEDLIKLIDALNASQKKATILLLSDELQKDDALDANVINHLIYIEGHLKSKHVEVVVELLDPKNDSIVKGFNIQNTIISNKMISLLLSKLALYQETAPFYEDLLTIEPNQDHRDAEAILIKEAHELFDVNFPILFSSRKQWIESSFYAFDQDMICFGYFREEQLTIFEGNLHKEEPFSLYENDRLILMKL